MMDFLNLILEPLQEVFAKFKEFAPNLLAMLVILAVGILLARLLRAILVKVPDSGQVRQLVRPDGIYHADAQRRSVGETVIARRRRSFSGC